MRFVGKAPDTLTLDRGEEAFGDGIVMAVALSAHRVLQMVGSDEGRSVHVGELRSLIRVDRAGLGLCASCQCSLIRQERSGPEYMVIHVKMSEAHILRQRPVGEKILGKRVSDGNLTF